MNGKLACTTDTLLKIQQIFVLNGAMRTYYVYINSMILSCSIFYMLGPMDHIRSEHICAGKWLTAKPLAIYFSQNILDTLFLRNFFFWTIVEPIFRMTSFVHKLLIYLFFFLFFVIYRLLFNCHNFSF